MSVMLLNSSLKSATASRKCTPLPLPSHVHVSFSDHAHLIIAPSSPLGLKFLNIDDPSLIHSTAVVKGDGVKLSCSVEAEPNATVSWSFQPKEAGCLPKLNASTFWYSTSKQFVFEYATSYAEYCDAGIYTCVVSNGFKEISTQLRLRVRGMYVII